MAAGLLVREIVGLVLVQMKEQSRDFICLGHSGCQSWRRSEDQHLLIYSRLVCMLSNFMPAAHMVRLARQQQHMLSV